MRGQQAGFSLIELLIVIAIIVVLVAAGIPIYRQLVMAAHELAAIQAIRTIHTAETQYDSQFGRFARALTDLGPPPGGVIGPGSGGADRRRPGNRKEEWICVYAHTIADWLCRERGSRDVQQLGPAHVLFGSDDGYPVELVAGAGNGEELGAAMNCHAIESCDTWQCNKNNSRRLTLYVDPVAQKAGL